MFNIKDAVTILKKKYNLIPLKYTMYNNDYLIYAYPPGTKNPDKVMSPWYIVDTKTKKVGPFSPIFDLEGFNEATRKMRSI